MLQRLKLILISLVFVTNYNIAGIPFSDLMAILLALPHLNLLKRVTRMRLVQIVILLTIIHLIFFPQIASRDYFISTEFVKTFSRNLVLTFAYATIILSIRDWGKVTRFIFLFHGGALLISVITYSIGVDVHFVHDSLRGVLIDENGVFGVFVKDGDTRYSGLMSEPAHIALLLVLCYFAGWGFRNKFLLILLVLVNFFLIKSFSGYFLIVGYFVSTILNVRQFKRYGLIAIASIPFILVAISSSDRFQKIMNFEDASANVRLINSFVKVSNAFDKHPDYMITGVGAGQSEEYLSRQFEVFGNEDIHISFLVVVFTYGLSGLILIIYVLRKVDLKYLFPYLLFVFAYGNFFSFIGFLFLYQAAPRIFNVNGLGNRLVPSYREVQSASN